MQLIEALDFDTEHSEGILHKWKTLQCAESFVPDLVLESVVTNALSEKPSRISDVCVVFLADISGFTKLSETLCHTGNENGLDTLNETISDYFARMIDMIYAHGGDVMKFAGDALLAVWRPKTLLWKRGKNKNDTQAPTSVDPDTTATATATTTTTTTFLVSSKPILFKKSPIVAQYCVH